MIGWILGIGLAKAIAVKWGASGCAISLLGGVVVLLMLGLVMQAVFGPPPPPPKLTLYPQPITLHICTDPITIYSDSYTASEHASIAKTFETVAVHGEKGAFYYLKNSEGELWVLKDQLCTR